MLALYMALIGFLNIACFIIGAKVGQTVAKGKDITMPNLNPLEAYRKSEAKKAVRNEQDKMSKIMRNIERYDGTSKGQEDVN